MKRQIIVYLALITVSVGLISWLISMGTRVESSASRAHLDVTATGASFTSGATGRYQVSGTASHAIIIDTSTGQAWSALLSRGTQAQDPDFFGAKIKK